MGAKLLFLFFASTDFYGSDDEWRRMYGRGYKKIDPVRLFL